MTVELFPCEGPEPLKLLHVLDVPASGEDAVELDIRVSSLSVDRTDDERNPGQAKAYERSMSSIDVKM